MAASGGNCVNQAAGASDRSPPIVLKKSESNWAPVVLGNNDSTLAIALR
jgi:hypothetical protein